MQTWKIKGQVFTHAQLMEMKKQGIDPRKDKVIMKFITKPKNEVLPEKAAEEVKAPVVEDVPIVPEVPVEVASETVTPETPVVETELEEFERLKVERAWKSAAKKDRYAELKLKLNK